MNFAEMSDLEVIEFLRDSTRLLPTELEDLTLEAADRLERLLTTEERRAMTIRMTCATEI